MSRKRRKKRRRGRGEREREREIEREKDSQRALFEEIFLYKIDKITIFFVFDLLFFSEKKIFK